MKSRIAGLLATALLAACQVSTPSKPAATPTLGPVRTSVATQEARAEPSPTPPISSTDLPVRSAPTPTLDQQHGAAIRQLINDANRAWAAAVGRGGNANELATYYVEPKLSELTGDVQQLRQQNRVRDAQVVELRIDKLTFTSDTRAEAVTYERWTDSLLDANGGVIRRYPSIVADTYTLVLQNGRWFINGTTEQVIQQ
jgi:hypothetical protein